MPSSETAQFIVRLECLSIHGSVDVTLTNVKYTAGPTCIIYDLSAKVNSMWCSNYSNRLQVMLSKATITEKCFFSCKVTVQTIDYYYFLNLYDALKQALILVSLL